MSFRLVPNSVTLNGVMAVILRYFTEFGKHAFQHIPRRSVAEFKVSRIRITTVAAKVGLGNK